MPEEKKEPKTEKKVDTGRAKVLINPEFELTDVIKKLNEAPQSEVVITFAENSDLLVSPINLKVIQDTADELEKVIIMQIVQNPIGLRNAKAAGVTATEQASVIPEELWTTALNRMEERVKNTQSKLRQSSFKAPESQKEDKSNKIEAPKGPENDFKVHNDPIVEDVETDENHEPEETSNTNNAEKERTEFQRRIDEALAKSRKDLQEDHNKIVQDGDFIMAIDEDISTVQSKMQKSVAKSDDRPTSDQEATYVREELPSHTIQTKQNSLVGRDFRSLKSELHPKEKLNRGQGIGSRITSPDRSALTGGLTRTASAGAKGASSLSLKVAGFLKNLALFPAKFAAKQGSKTIFILSIPIVAILGLVFYGVYTYLPLVKVNVFIESRQVSAEKTFQGNTSVDTFDFDSGVVPMKSETITKKLSDNAVATGVAYRGSAAGGIVTIKCWKDIDDKITIDAGTTITNGEQSYVTVASVEVNCLGYSTTTVEAAEVGEEYNLPAGNIFSVGSFAQTEVVAENTAAFSGGSKEEYTVISQEDVDKVVEDLQKAAFAEAEGELKDKNKSAGWAIIESTIKSEQEGDVETDVPVGTEADMVNITLETKSTALYYQKGEIENIAGDLIKESAIENNLFESDNNLELKLDNNIEHSITVESIEGDSATLKLTASGSVKPDISKNEITTNLLGKSWDDGIKYLNSLDFVAKPSEVKFTPERFPDFMRHFPNRQGRVLVTVKEVVVEAEQAEIE